MNNGPVSHLWEPARCSGSAAAVSYTTPERAIAVSAVSSTGDSPSP